MLTILQRAYFKCAHECFESFDQRRRQEVISNWNRRHEDKSSFDWKRRHKEISSIDRLERQKEISTCIKHCNVPFVNARQKVEKDMAMFQVITLSHIVFCDIVLFSNLCQHRPITPPLINYI